MQVRVQKIDSNGVLLPLQIAEALELVEGTEIEVRIAAAEPTPHAREIRFASLEEVRAAHCRTEPEYREVYRELAK